MGIGHAVAMITVLIMLIFFAFIFSSVTNKKDNTEQQFLSDREQKFMVKNSLSQFFDEPLEYQSMKMPVRDFISFSLVANQDTVMFGNSARDHFFKTLPSQITQWRILLPGTDYEFGFLDCPGSFITTTLPIAYHGIYESKDVEIDYTSLQCTNPSRYGSKI